MNTKESPAITAAGASTKRPLEGLAVGISISVGEDSVKQGCTEEEVNHSVVRLSDALLSRGARLVFGYDWRPRGPMSAVARLAVAYEPGLAVTDHQPVRRACRITNLVPWGSRPELPPDLRDELESRGMLRLEEVPLPATIAQHAGVYERRTLRAAGFCVLRKRLAKLCEALICLGGKLENSEDFWSGILEEALFSASSDHKVLLCGMLGGASAKVLQAARLGDWAELQEVNPEMRKGYETLKEMLKDADLTIFPDISRVQELLSRKRLQQRSGLTDEDFDRLSDATDIEVVAALAIKALSRRAASGNALFTKS
jgi:hypothetical protein